MDTPRGASPTSTTSSTGTAASPANYSNKKRRGIAWLRFIFIGLLFSTTVLAAALIVFLFIGGPTQEAKFVNKKQYQAVFLNNGQVYFGYVKDLNGKYIRMQSIYYLRQNTAVQPDQSTSGNSNFSLVKLGCEVHGPSDEMIVNRDQVTFWENLKSDGQVAKAVDAYIKQNPSGQQCDQSTQKSSTPAANTPATPVKKP